MKVMKLHLATQEGQELFHLGIKVDKALRKLVVAALQRQIPADRYRFLAARMDDSVGLYHQFLDSSFNRFAASKDGASGFAVYPHMKNYKALLSDIRSSGPIAHARVSTETGEKIFKLVHSTDVCIRIIENYATLHIEKALQLRWEVQEQIRLLRLSEEECTREMYALQVRKRKLQIKNRAGTQK